MSHFPKPEAFRADAPQPASEVRRNPGSIAEMLAMLADRMAQNGPKPETQDPYDELLGFGTDAEDRADQEVGSGWDPETIGTEDEPDDDEKLADIDPAYYSDERITERVEATVERRGLFRI